MKVRQEVKGFALEMEMVLRLNDKKKIHWSELSLKWLFKRLNDECKELKNEINKVSNPYILTKKEVNRIIRESADVANFAMMIADNAKHHQVR